MSKTTALKATLLIAINIAILVISANLLAVALASNDDFDHGRCAAYMEQAGATDEDAREACEDPAVQRMILDIPNPNQEQEATI